MERGKSVQSLEDYLDYLQGKGFQLHEDAIGFIYFGKHYTNASDEIINTAVEITLKAQKSFDGSFYISLLETLMVNKVKNRKDAIRFVKERELLAI
ncbi:hypothetical protein IEC97_01730 [Neobacillus cucumis]|uniref:DUF6123 family protein n=1 Tax=Neobacillus cucumis TaxID=1740721 RepID=UPI0018DF1C12|nr:DUF6123 family protein [Neobacillus cucumis]MBI0576066.1 hypothetical protein [Neobacillus cucumis]